MSSRRIKAFTLIELMIVVAIVAILAAIAIPAYRNYTARAQLSEAFTLIGNAKTAINAYVQSGGQGEPNTGELSNNLVGLPELSGQYVENVVISGTYVQPIIEAIINPTAAAVVSSISEGVGMSRGEAVTRPDGLLTSTVNIVGNYSIVYRGAVDNGGSAFNWQCVSNIAQKFLPHGCVETRSTAVPIEPISSTLQSRQ